MNRLRALGLVTLLAGAATPAVAQDFRDRFPPDTVNVQRRFPLRGQVAHLHPRNMEVGINARSVSGGRDGAMAVPYLAISRADYQRFKLSDWVMGEIIVSNNRMYVINLRIVSEDDVLGPSPDSPRVKPAPSDPTRPANP